MGWLFKAIAIAGCTAAASAAQALPLFYDEALRGDIQARRDNIPLFNFDVGNNVIAGSQFFRGEFDAFDVDIFSFVVPQDSVLRFVTVEFGAFDFTRDLTAFGPSYTIVQGLFSGNGQFVDTSRSATRPFTDVLTSVGPQNLFTRLPVGAGMYDWINELGFTGEQRANPGTSAMWNYRLTFGVESTSVPEPAPLALMGLGLVAVFLGRRRGARVGGDMNAA